MISIAIFPSILAAESSEEKRRIEEGKRVSLRPSEGRIFEERRAEPASIDPIDLHYFIEQINKGIAFRYDASRALVILMRVESQFIDLDSQITYLKQKNLLPKRFEKVLLTVKNSYRFSPRQGPALQKPGKEGRQSEGVM